ncbi:hypothetical protein [Mycobacterium avium]|uniref:hypothetical protein n=1 Tax=Mycobacterium avium TaxID=1764 RepID=UPI000CE3E26C|nr:hypothetical protein [Mycobacterium avium]
MREVQTISKPYAVEMVREGNRVVEVVIKSVGDGSELDMDTIRDATRSLLEHFRRQELSSSNKRVRDLPASVLQPLSLAYNKGRGKVTDEYLARLAVAYEELSAVGASVLVSLAAELDKPVPTIRTHIKQAESRGYLTETTQGSKDGRKATQLARELLET